MPGSMIHLMLAREVNPKGSDLFYLGNIAPDAVTDWKEKEKTHYRNAANREKSLRDFEKNVGDDFSEGMLLHLYFDYKWDEVMIKSFINHIGEDWFKAYRKELSITGSYFYHRLEYAEQIWDMIDKISINLYKPVPSATNGELKDFVHRNYVWHQNTVCSESYFFTEKVVTDFVKETAEEFIMWRNLF